MAAKETNTGYYFLQARPHCPLVVNLDQRVLRNEEPGSFEDLGHDRHGGHRSIGFCERIPRWTQSSRNCSIDQLTEQSVSNLEFVAVTPAPFLMRPLRYAQRYARSSFGNDLSSLTRSHAIRRRTSPAASSPFSAMRTSCRIGLRVEFDDKRLTAVCFNHPSKSSKLLPSKIPSRNSGLDKSSRTLSAASVAGSDLTLAGSVLACNDPCNLLSPCVHGCALLVRIVGPIVNACNPCLVAADVVDASLYHMRQCYVSLQDVSDKCASEVVDSPRWHRRLDASCLACGRDAPVELSLRLRPAAETGPAPAKQVLPAFPLLREHRPLVRDTVIAPIG
jgi:hypothetical protein